MLISEVFKLAGISSQLPTAKDNFNTTCPACNESVRLSDCDITEDDGETNYLHCKTLLVIVSKKIDIPRAGYGYRLKDYVIRNVVDLHFGRVVIPASPDAMAGKDQPK